MCVGCAPGSTHTKVVGLRLQAVGPVLGMLVWRLWGFVVLGLAEELGGVVVSHLDGVHQGLLCGLQGLPDLVGGGLDVRIVI